jgi:hypothetical protein
MALRRNMQRGYAAGGFVTPGIIPGGGNATNALLADIRDRLYGMELKVNLIGTMQGQTFLKQEMPRYQKFDDKKHS